MRSHTLLTAALLLSSSSAFANLVFIQNVDLTGTGLGTVPTILTQQDKNGGRQDLNVAGVSSGCVGYGTSGDVIGPDACLGLTGMTGGEEKTGASQTLTRALSDPAITALGINSLAKLGIVYNSSNQQNNAQVTLTQLALTIYNGADLVFFATLDQPYTLTGFAGTGNSGYLFALDDAQLALANSQISPFNYGDLRIGLNALVSNDQAGNETFFVGYYDRQISNEPPEVPEPATAGLAGVALLSAGLLRFGSRKA